MIEERIRFSSGPLKLSGKLAYPENDEPRFATLLCAPHPNFAGNMDNNVIVALTTRLARESVVLRFDYRGVGESEIQLQHGVSVFDFWNDIEEHLDYAQPLEDVRSAADELKKCSHGLPMIVCGYSFGAIVGLQHGCRDDAVKAMAGISPPLVRHDFLFLKNCSQSCLMLSGSDDFVYDEKKAESLKQIAGPGVQFELRKSADHFFRGEEEAVADHIACFLIQHVHSEKKLN